MQFFVAIVLLFFCSTTNGVTHASTTTTPDELWKSFDKRLAELERQQEIIKLKIYKWIRTFQPVTIDQRSDDGSSIFDKDVFNSLFNVEALRSIKVDMRQLIESNAASLQVQQTEVVVKNISSPPPTTSPCTKSDHKEYCSSFTNAYTAYIPVNGTSFKFKVRARYDAVLGFATRAWEKPIYDIMIGDYANSKTNVYKDRFLILESLTPGILDPCEFRGFWVSWDNNIVRVGRQGNPAPILTHPIDGLHPVNFIGIRTTVHSMGDWII